MGLGNDQTLSGHLGVNISWGGGHGHNGRRRLNTIPLPARRSVLDEYFSRPALPPGKVGVAKKKATAGDPLQSAALVSNALQAAGFPEKVQPFVMDQTAMETSGFTSDAFLKDNNASGISPTKGHPKGSTKWRYFPSINDWAIAMKSIVSMDKGAGKPIAATTLKDYIHRLKVNGYFGSESEGSYYGKVNAAGVRWRNIESLQEDTHQKIVMPKGGGLMALIKAHPLATGVAAAVGGILVLKAVMN